jgi:TonB family protein
MTEPRASRNPQSLQSRRSRNSAPAQPHAEREAPALLNRRLALSDAILALVLLLCLAGVLPALLYAGSAPNDDPQKLLAEAAPYYEYSQPDIHPWRLKASYQLFDADGKVAGAGAFEYWWDAPGIDRATWTRDGKTLSEWHFAKGGYAFLSDGLRLGYDEHRLQSVLFSPLADAVELDPSIVELAARSLGKHDNALRCVMVGPKVPNIGDAPTGLFPTYCFDGKLPVLLARLSFEAPVIEYQNIVKTQNHYLARQVSAIGSNNKTVFSISVDALDGISPSDPAFKPPPAADIYDRRPYGPLVTGGKALLKTPAVYPAEARQKREQGTVRLMAILGRDGRVHVSRVESAPSISLAASAMAAVAHWRYQPFLLKGNPIDVNTVVVIKYSLNP